MHACFSLSHKGLDISYYEIRAVGSVRLLLRTAMTRADLGCNRLAERSISRCETHLGLCDRLAYALTGMFTRSVEGCPWSREDSRLAALTVNPGLPSLAYSRPLRGSLPARRRSGGCVIAAGPIIRYPRVAACEQYQVPGGDDAGEVDDELEG